MRAAPTSIRFACAAVFALLLAVRSLAPVGFMPAFDHGSVAIVICPGANSVSTAVGAQHHHRGDPDSGHQPCPYAAASPLATVAGEWPLLLGTIVFAVLLLLGRTPLSVERNASHERPPTRGPPILA